MFHNKGILLTVLSVFLLSGCASSLGPRSIPTARYLYNEAIVQSQDQQMLLNLVRLRYQDTPIFLDLDSVVASYSVSSDINLNWGISSTPDVISRSFGVDGKLLGWSDNPTVTYSPLKGDEFAKRTMAPIKPELLMLLSQGGWGIERLMICCVQQLNKLPNARRFVDVPPSREDTVSSLAWLKKFKEYQYVVSKLRFLQDAGYIQLASREKANQVIMITSGPIPLDEQGRSVLRQVAELLGVAKDVEAYFLIEPNTAAKPAEIQVFSRSLLGTMAFLAQGVDVPEAHQKAGLIKSIIGPDGENISSKDITLGYFRVRSAKNKPDNAKIQVYYRDYWYWIADDDLESKGTFTLLNQIFNLQAASSQSLKPLLSIPR